VSDRVSVLIVDDHEVFAEGMAMILASAPDLRCSGVAHSAEQGLRLARELKPDVVLLDHHLPDRNGASAVGEFAAAGVGAVVILTSDTSEDVLLASFEAGAAGYLLKTRAAQHVLDGVRHAAAGETLISASTLARVLRRRSGSGGARQHSQLTDRELEVLVAMSEGLDTAAIGERLGVTLSTTRTYIQSVLEKLEASSRLQAVVRAKQLGLLS
jgi:DNA-binding NarL/FixJ family response regulator